MVLFAFAPGDQARTNFHLADNHKHTIFDNYNY